MEEKKDKRSVLNVLMDDIAGLMCGTVGGKMGLEAAKLLIPNSTLFTRIGGFLIGSGIGDIAGERVSKTIDGCFEMGDKIAKFGKLEEPEKESEVIEVE